MSFKQVGVELLKKFHVKPEQIDTIKQGVYRVTSINGERFCLKRMGMRAEQLLWTDSVLLDMRRCGFHGVAWRDPASKYGKRLIARPSSSSAPYILTPWLTGSIPNDESHEELFSCAQALARFHEAGKLVAASHKSTEQWLGRWPTLFQSRIKLLQREIARSNARKQPSRFEALLQQHGSWLLERANAALKLVDNKEYKRLCRTAESTNAILCHADSGPKNFVLTAEGPCLIDFESLRYDLRIYDLYRMIRLASKNNGWNIDAARSIINGYSRVSELEPIEYDLLSAWLLFPQRPYRIMNMYRMADKSLHPQLETKLSKAIEMEMPINGFLHEFDETRLWSDSNETLGDD